MWHIVCRVSKSVCGSLSLVRERRTKQPNIDEALSATLGLSITSPCSPRERKERVVHYRESGEVVHTLLPLIFPHGYLPSSRVVRRSERTRNRDYSPRMTGIIQGKKLVKQIGMKFKACSPTCQIAILAGCYHSKAILLSLMLPVKKRQRERAPPRPLLPIGAFQYVYPCANHNTLEASHSSHEYTS